MSGLSNLFNPFKPGHGVDKNRPKKKKFFIFFEIYFRKFWKLSQLSLIYFICCVPILTIGPATAAFTSVLKSLINELPCFILNDYFHAFKSNWKKAFVVSIIQTIIILLIMFANNFYISNLATSKIYLIPYILSIAFLIIFLFMSYYIYLILTTIEINIVNLFKNSFLFAFIGAKGNIITTIIVGIVVYITFVLYPISLLFLIPFGFSTIGFIVCFISFPYIKKHIIDMYNSTKCNDESNQDDCQIFTDIGSNERKIYK